MVMMRIIWSNTAKADIKEIYSYYIVYKVFAEKKEVLIATVFDTRQNPAKLKV